MSERVFSLADSGRRQEAFTLAQQELQGRLQPALTQMNREVYRRARESSVRGAYARLEEILAVEGRTLLVIIALTLAVGLVVSWVISRGLTRPIRDLTAAMAVVGSGKLDHPVTPTSRDEIGELAGAFGRMTESLRRNVAQLERTQAQLVQSEKLASIGEMSAAVAHGLRNPLASLRAAAQLVRRHPDSPAAGETLEAIIEEVDRLDRRISHLLSFSRPAPFNPMPEKVDRLVEGLLPAFSEPLRERGVELRLELARDLPEVRVDPMQMEQALLELVSNALDAMPKGGTPPADRTGRRWRAAGLGGARRGCGHRRRHPRPCLAFGLRALLHDSGGGHRSGARYRQAVRRAEWRPSGDSEHAWSRHHGPGPSAHRSGGLSGTVLIVDDERTLARSVRAFLIQSGYDAEVAPDAEQALGMLETLRPDVVFSDMRLPGMNGVELLAPGPGVRSFDRGHHHDRLRHHRRRRRGGQARRVRLPEEAGGSGGAQVAGRPRAADSHRSSSSSPTTVGGPRAMCRSAPCSASRRPCVRSWSRHGRSRPWTRRRPSSSSARPAPARGWSPGRFTRRSSRAPKPFIEVNCTALPATLMEAELFGHERGAFTDAKESRMGLFEAAEGGFLFLDEVGDVELSLQGKLLKAVEERTVRRVGGIRDRKIDVRILAATQSRPRARVAA